MDWTCLFSIRTKAEEAKFNQCSLIPEPLKFFWLEQAKGISLHQLQMLVGFLMLEVGRNFYNFLELTI